MSYLQAAPIFTLPNEIVFAILKKLARRNAHPRDALHLSATCKHFHYVITNDAETQYELHLFAEGLVDDGTQRPSSTLQDRLTRLIDLRSSWRTFSWKRIVDFSTDQEWSGEQPKLRKGTFIWTTEEKTPLLYRLPTHAEPEKLTRCDDVEAFNASYFIDPEQDLMVLFNVRESFEGPYARMVLRTLSNKTHPDARIPFLECYMEDDMAFSEWPNDHNHVQVLEDVLAYWTHRYRRLVLWNWKTGVMFLDYYFGGDDPTRPTRNAPRFAFLTPLCFIVLDCEGSGSLDLFSVESAASSNVLQVDSSSETTPRDPVHIASFALPTINSGLRVGGIGITGHPASSPSVRRVSKSPFALAPDGHVYRLDVIYVPHPTVNPNDVPLDRNIFCEFFIHARTFLEHLSYATTTEPGVEVDVRKIPWSEWGPKGSRVFCGRSTDPVDEFDTALHATHQLHSKDHFWNLHGQRASAYRSHTNGPIENRNSYYTYHTWKIVEFGYHVMQYPLLEPFATPFVPIPPRGGEFGSEDFAKERTTKRAMRTTIGPSTIPKETGVFEQDVVSCLPYHVVVLDNVEGSVCYIDDERVQEVWIDHRPGANIFNFRTIVF